MVSKARHAAVASFVIVMLASFVAWQETMRIPRATLPREAVSELSKTLSTEGGVFAIGENITRFRSKLILVPLDGSTRLEELKVQLSSLMPSEFTIELGKGNSGPTVPESCSGSGKFSSEACLKALSEDTGDSGIEGYWISVVVADGDPVLIVDAGTHAILRWSQKRFPDAKTLATAVVERLQQTWLRPIQLGKEAPLLGLQPAYTFAFYLVSSGEEARIHWDFLRDVFSPYLRLCFERLHLLFDFEMDSQVVNVGKLGGRQIDKGAGTTEGSHPVSIIEATTLQTEFLANANEFPGDVLSRGHRWLPPLARFIAFLPSVSGTEKLRIMDRDKQLQQSFAVQGWGAAAILDAKESSPPVKCPQISVDEGIRFLSTEEAQQAASMWISHLRSWLSLPSHSVLPSDITEKSDSNGLPLLVVEPRRYGVAKWEMNIAARNMHYVFIRRTAEELQNLDALVESLPEVAVHDHIAGLMAQALEQTQSSIKAAELGEISSAMSSAKRALRVALAATYDDSIQAQTYFSWEFKYAVYLPIFLPIVLPVCSQVYRELRRWKKSRAQAREAAAQRG